MELLEGLPDADEGYGDDSDTIYPNSESPREFTENFGSADEDVAIADDTHDSSPHSNSGYTDDGGIVDDLLEVEKETSDSPGRHDAEFPEHYKDIENEEPTSQQDFNDVIPESTSHIGSTNSNSATKIVKSSRSGPEKRHQRGGGEDFVAKKERLFDPNLIPFNVTNMSYEVYVDRHYAFFREQWARETMGPYFQPSAGQSFFHSDMMGPGPAGGFGFPMGDGPMGNMGPNNGGRGRGGFRGGGGGRRGGGYRR